MVQKFADVERLHDVDVCTTASVFTHVSVPITIGSGSQLVSAAK